jgi:hypothetical protein
VSMSEVAEHSALEITLESFSELTTGRRSFSYKCSNHLLSC